MLLLFVLVHARTDALVSQERRTVLDLRALRDEEVATPWIRAPPYPASKRRIRQMPVDAIQEVARQEHRGKPWASVVLLFHEEGAGDAGEVFLQDGRHDEQRGLARRHGGNLCG